MLASIALPLLLLQGRTAAIPPKPTLTVVYAKRGDKALEMDVYRPMGSAKPMPIVLLFHGGGYVMGNRTWMNRHVDELNRAGLAVATVSYRLAPAARVPEILEDGRTAVRYVRDHAGELGVDGTRVAAFGHSAGAHMALLLGYQSKKGDRSRVDAVVAVSAPTDFSRDYSEKTLETYASVLVGKPLKDAGEELQSYSATSYVAKDLPPTLLIHGTVDKTISVDQSKVLATRLEAAGAPFELFLVEGANHLYHLEMEKWSSAFAKATEFLKKNLAG